MSKVLIVDDSMYTRSLIVDILSDQGHEIEQASSGEEMFQLLDSFAPDVVFVDIILPGINGLDAIKMLHKQKPGVKVIVCSAQSLQSVKDEAFKNGASGYIQKPFGVDILKDELNKVLG